MHYFAVPYQNRLVISKEFRHLSGYHTLPKRIDECLHMIHPDDVEYVVNYLEQSLEIMSQVYLRPFASKLYISCHLKKIDGSDLYLLFHNTPFVTNESGEVEMILGSITDISFLKTNKKVRAVFQHESHTYLLHEMDRITFTRREKEILTHLAQGLTSYQIANQLYISKTTVDKHRQNMLKMANVTNTMELILFSVEHDIIHLEC